MNTKVLTSLRAGFSPFPLSGFSNNMYRFNSWSSYNTCDIILGKKQLTFNYNTVLLGLPVRRTRNLLYSDIDSFYAPYRTVVHLNHHSKTVPKYVTIGQILYDETRLMETKLLIKSLKAHHIPAKVQSSQEKKRIASLLVIFGVILGIGLTILVWVSAKTTQ